MSEWGRVTDDGAVFVRTAEGEREVGSWHAGTPADERQQRTIRRVMSTDALSKKRSTRFSQELSSGGAAHFHDA